MTQSFTSFPEETPAEYWVLSSRDYNGLTETLFYGETQIFECIYFNPSNYAVSMCNFEGVEPANALEHYNAFSKHVKNDIKIISDDLYDFADENVEEIDYELAIQHANEVRNALRELKNNICLDSILCGVVEIFSSLQKEEVHLKLKVGYTEEDLAQFCKSLDVNYDAGYGGQEVYGVIWLKDGTWFTREEYDGNEWWEHHTVPDIPDVLKG